MQVTEPMMSVVDNPDTHWRFLQYFNLYRLVIAATLVVTSSFFGSILTFGSQHPEQFFLISDVYLLCSALLTLTVSSRWPGYLFQLHMQMITDLICIFFLMETSGGILSGMGVLMTISLAAVGLFGNERYAMFYAAFATILILVGQVWQICFYHAGMGSLVYTGLLSLSFFAVSGLASVLSIRLGKSEQLTRKQSADLASLATINQLIIEDMQDGVLVLDAQHQIRQCNKQAVQMLGMFRPMEGLVSKRCPDPLIEHIRIWQNAPDKILPSLVLPDNQQVRTRFVRAGRGEQQVIVAYLDNLTKLQAQAQQIKLAALGRLTMNIAHEIRNPLSAISHAGELLGEELGKREDMRRLLQIVQTNTQRIEKIVKDVLYLNKHDRSERKTIWLAHWLKHFGSEFCQIEKIDPSGLCIEVQGAPVLCFDENHLYQILWNLCQNAWRHSRGKKGSVCLRSYVQKNLEQVHIEVRDDGIGVTDAQVPQLFEPFYTTVPTGTGLGLYLAREISEANGAALHYVGNEPGGVFRLSSREGAC
ncbi:MAG: PAS domain-containing sensor histidine kinase [Proteobacteria bacterium]|nr:PAS domain-containing sensor histidine kinase [Pseudomonadota bacterium]